MEQRRTIVQDVAPTAGSQRRACRWLGMHRSAVRYRSVRRDETALRQRLRDLVDTHARWGAPRLIWQLRDQEGWPDNHKRIRRLYRAEGLLVPRRGRRKKAVQPRVPLSPATQPNERWAMDFMRDTLASGAAFRSLTVVDTCTRESPAIEVDTSLPGERVVTVLDAIATERGYPKATAVPARHVTGSVTALITSFIMIRNYETTKRSEKKVERASRTIHDRKAAQRRVPQCRRPIRR